jgi:hypothetical protein
LFSVPIVVEKAELATIATNQPDETELDNVDVA